MHCCFLVVVGVLDYFLARSVATIHALPAGQLSPNSPYYSHIVSGFYFVRLDIRHRHAGRQRPDHLGLTDNELATLRNVLAKL